LKNCNLTGDKPKKYRLAGDIEIRHESRLVAAAKNQSAIIICGGHRMAINSIWKMKTAAAHRPRQTAKMKNRRASAPALGIGGIKR